MQLQCVIIIHTDYFQISIIILIENLFKLVFIDFRKSNVCNL